MKLRWKFRTERCVRRDRLQAPRANAIEAAADICIPVMVGRRRVVAVAAVLASFAMLIVTTLYGNEGLVGGRRKFHRAFWSGLFSHVDGDDYVDEELHAHLYTNPMALGQSGTTEEPDGRPVEGEMKLLNDSQSMATEQKLRKQRLTRACLRYADLWQNESAWHYHVHYRRGYIFCPIPRAGSSSWRHALLDAGVQHNATSAADARFPNTSRHGTGESRMSLSGVVSWKKAEHMSRALYSFAFVRNPWTRLVSAFIGTVADSNRSQSVLRACSSHTTTSAATPEAQHLKASSFAKFLECIVSNRSSLLSMDALWTPMWTLCDFCRLRYDFLGHMETFDADASYVARSLNVTAIPFPNILPSISYRTQDVAKAWYKAVPRNVIEKLRSLYKFDFILHGYSDLPPGWNARSSKMQ